MRPIISNILLCLTTLLFSSCTSVALVDSWQGGAAQNGRKYQRLLVAGMLKNRQDRCFYENDVAGQLLQQRIVTYTGDHFFKNDGRPSRQALAEAVANCDADAVITIHIIMPEPEHNGAGGGATLESISSYPDYWLPALFSQWSLYPHYGITYFHQPGEWMSAPGEQLIQVNLFDAESGRLMWAGKLETVVPLTGPIGDEDVGSVIVEALMDEGLI